jgi:hypothetical protein
LSYEACSQTTFAIVFNVKDKVGDDLLRHLRSSMMMVQTPLLLPTLIAHTSNSRCKREVERNYLLQFEVEKATKFKMIYDHAETAPDLKTLNLVQITKLLNSICVRISFEIQACEASLGLLKFLEDTNESFPLKNVMNQDGNAAAVTKALLAKITHLQSSSVGILTRSKYLMQRAQAQVQTVSRLSRFMIVAYF